jgi:hypothetical protein
MIFKTIYIMIKTVIDLPENLYRSHRLGDEDIKAMSKKGYTVFDADKGRFVRPSAQFIKMLQTDRREVTPKVSKGTSDRENT